MTDDVKRFHRLAMEHCGRADQVQGDSDAEKFYTNAAFELELQAINALGETDSELTRSVLIRSAATMAYVCGRYDEAKELVQRGLAGDPPLGIKVELDDLYREIHLACLTNATKPVC